MTTPKRLARFIGWWRAPVTPRDRMAGAVVGAFAGFWLGLLGRIALGLTPVPVSTALAWGVGIAMLIAVLGAVFPRAVSVVLFPFATFGPG